MGDISFEIHVPGVLLSHFVLCAFSSYKDFGFSIFASRQARSRGETAQREIKRRLLSECFVIQKWPAIGSFRSKNIQTQISGLYTVFQFAVGIAAYLRGYNEPEKHVSRVELSDINLETQDIVQKRKHWIPKIRTDGGVFSSF